MSVETMIVQRLEGELDGLKIWEDTRWAIDMIDDARDIYPDETYRLITVHEDV